MMEASYGNNANVQAYNFDYTVSIIGAVAQTAKDAGFELGVCFMYNTETESFVVILRSHIGVHREICNNIGELTNFVRSFSPFEARKRFQNMQRSNSQCQSQS